MHEAGFSGAHACAALEDFRELNGHGWESALRELRENQWAHTLLRDGPGGVGEYQLEYFGSAVDVSLAAEEPGRVRALSCWLSTEFLEPETPKQAKT